MLDEVAAIAKETGFLLLEEARKMTSLDVEEKGRRDYVTRVDFKAEELILNRLSRSFPGISFLAEESGGAADLSGATWVIDPLDGTKNFIHGFPFYCVSIALYQDGKGVLGVIYEPTRQELFFAERGKGAKLNGRPIRVAKDDSVSHALIGTGFPFRSLRHFDSYLECFRRIFAQVSGMRRAGSACLDQCYVACGRVDGFWELGLRPWDLAAGTMIIQEAGGVVSDFSGGNRFLFGGDIIAGRSEVHEALLAEIRSVFEDRRPVVQGL